jgi:hypothetical protein
MRRRHTAVMVMAVVLMLPVAAGAQTSSTTSSTSSTSTSSTSTSSTSTSSTSTTSPPVISHGDPLCAPEGCFDSPPAAFLRAGGPEVAAEPGGYSWIRALPNGTREGVVVDVFLPAEPSSTLAVVQGGPLTLRFDPPLTLDDLVIRRGAILVAPPSEMQTLAAPVSDPSRFTADLPLGISYLTVSATFAQGGVTSFFKLDVRPAVAVPTRPVVASPTFTG